MERATQNLENDHQHILKLIAVMEEIVRQGEPNISHLEEMVELIRKFADGLHLCRGLNDDEVFCHDGAGYSHLSTDWQGAGWRLARSGVAGQGAAPGEHPWCTPRSAGSGSSISVGNDLSPCHQ